MNFDWRETKFLDLGKVEMIVVQANQAESLKLFDIIAFGFQTETWLYMLSSNLAIYIYLFSTLPIL